MESLVWIDRLWLQQHPDTPKLYDSGIRYEPEFNIERWQDIPSTIKRGYGDCDDLSTWLIAEYREQGVDAKPWVKWAWKKDGSVLFHALVKLPDRYIYMPYEAKDRFTGNGGRYEVRKIEGPIEDPSLRLGMRHWRDYGCSDECKAAGENRPYDLKKKG